MKVCGQLEKAQLEHLSSDPSGDNLYSGRVWYNSTSDNLKCYDGTSIKELSPSINAVVVDYIIPDASGYSFIEVTDTTATRTVTLPTVADNKGRIIEIINTSTQKGKVIVDGEGSETINGFNTVDLDCKYSRIKIISTGSQWIVLDSFFNDKFYTMTVTNAEWSTDYAKGMPYRGLSGTWRLRFNIAGTLNPSGSTNTLAITDIIFSTTQSVSSSTTFSVALTHEVYVNGGSGNITAKQEAATSHSRWISGDVELTNKPAWLE